MAEGNRAASVIAEAERLVGDIQRQLDAAANFYAEYGIDPDKMVQALEPSMGPKEKEDLARIVQADQEAIQREVDEGAARLRFTSAAASVPKPRRSLV